MGALIIVEFHPSSNGGLGFSHAIELHAPQQFFLNLLVDRFYLSQRLRMMRPRMRLVNTFYLQKTLKPVDPVPGVENKPPVTQQLFHLSKNRDGLLYYRYYLINGSLCHQPPAGDEAGEVIQQDNQINLLLVNEIFQNVDLCQFQRPGRFKASNTFVFISLLAYPSIPIGFH